MRKRSDIREEEVAQLLAEGRARVRSREPTPQAQHWRTGMVNSKNFNSSTDLSTYLPRTPSGKHRVMHRRDASAGNSSPPQADFGEEYLHLSRRHTPNTRSYNQNLSSPHFSNMMGSMKIDDPVPRRKHSAFIPRSSSHTRNLSNALKQCKSKHFNDSLDGSSEVLMQQLESAAELADLLNQGLRASISHPVTLHSQNPEESRNEDLHTLLTYSDEQVRHLTEALLALMQEQRARASLQHGSRTPSQRSRQRILESSVHSSLSPATGTCHKHSLQYATQHSKELRGSLRQKAGSPSGGSVSMGTLWSAGRSGTHEMSLSSIKQPHHTEGIPKQALADLSVRSDVG